MFITFAEHSDVQIIIIVGREIILEWFHSVDEMYVNVL